MDPLDNTRPLKRLLFWTIPLAILLFQFFTVQWHDGLSCAAYGFPLPYVRWFGSSMEWTVAPFYLSVDFAFYLLVVALGERMVGSFMSRDRLPTWVNATLVFAVAGSGYLVLGAKLAMVFMRLIHPVGSIELAGVESAAFHFGPLLDYACDG